MYMSVLYLVSSRRERDPSPDTRTRDQRIMDDLRRGMSRVRASNKHGVSDHYIEGIVYAAALKRIQSL